MITIAVCDDNIDFSALLVNKIRDICAFQIPERYQCRVAGVMNSAQAVMDYLQQNIIDILFLDIDMPQENGFQLAGKINSRWPETLILFVSSHEELVFDSFSYRPFRFLRKHQLKTELEPALFLAVKQHLADSEFISVRTDYETIEIKEKNILYMKSLKNYFIVCGNGFEYKCRGTMSQAEELVKDYPFFRIHSGCLVNMERINCFESPNRLILDDITLYISQRRISEFKKSFSLYVRRRLL